MKNETKEGILVIYLEGNLLGMQFNTTVMNLIGQHVQAGNKNVLFNLSGVSYVDSAGLGLLLNAVSKIKNIGGRLALSNLPEQVKKLLKTTKVESIFLIFEDEASALAAIK